MFTRRSFLKTLGSLLVGAVCVPFMPRKSSAALIPKNARLSVVKSTEVDGMVRQALTAFGGIEQFVKPGANVVIKPNAAWSRTPEQSANTNPALLSQVIDLCHKAGAKSIKVVEFTCDNAESALKVNGIGAAVAQSPAELDILDKNNSFTEVAVPKGRVLKKVGIATAIRESDVFINMPVAKSHGSATLTMGMKNHMGAIQDRWYFHRSGLHECIADVSTVLIPDLIIVDALQIMLTEGPKGPGELKREDMIIVGTDQVAVDSYAASLFGYAGTDIGYIRMAYEHGLGEIDLAHVEIVS